MQKPSALLDDKKNRVFTSEEEAQKRLFYERMSPRRRKFVDRIGYDVWDPFEAPKEPMDIRVDVTHRTIQQLVQDFLRTVDKSLHEGEYARGVVECALGIVAREEKYRGVLDFCLWYHALLQKEHSAHEDEL